jgi:cyclophilin family peptidyl-prolyl cis-trans isomerase
MASRFGFTVALCLCMAGAATAQVVRFETTMGNFDLVLNPTHNALLQDQVDNFLHYVNENSYLGSWINRAAKGNNNEDFVLQMGSVFSNTKRPSLTSESIRPVTTIAPVASVPIQLTGLSNTVGTVSLALQPGNANSGTSSFFINLADNSFLDDQGFTVFAQVSDLTVVKAIMQLPTIDRRDDPLFGADPNDEATFGSVPVQSDGFQVLIKRAFVLTDTLSAAKAIAGAGALVEESQAAAQSAIASALASDSSSSPFDTSATNLSDLSASSSFGESGASELSSGAVPEPSSIFLAAMGLFGLSQLARPQRRS